MRALAAPTSELKSDAARKSRWRWAKVHRLSVIVWLVRGAGQGTPSTSLPDRSVGRSFLFEPSYETTTSALLLFRSFVLVRRWGEVGAATVGAGALLAVTGGLAAPAIVAGLTATGTTIGVSVGALATTRHPQKARRKRLTQACPRAVTPRKGAVVIVFHAQPMR